MSIVWRDALKQCLYSITPQIFTHQFWHSLMILQAAKYWFSNAIIPLTSISWLSTLRESTPLPYVYVFIYILMDSWLPMLFNGIYINQQYHSLFWCLDASYLATQRCSKLVPVPFCQVPIFLWTLVFRNHKMLQVYLYFLCPKPGINQFFQELLALFGLRMVLRNQDLGTKYYSYFKSLLVYLKNV